MKGPVCNQTTGWQPISSAPRVEGKRLRLLVNGEPLIGFWECWHGHGGIEAEGWNREGLNFPTGAINPTHWQEVESND